MPIKLWNADDEGNYVSVIKTNRASGDDTEKFRSEAEALDLEIDGVLDKLVALPSSTVEKNRHRQQFMRRWSIGRTIADSGIMQSPNLKDEDQEDLWLAFARKCRLGIRASGRSERRWRDLIPNRDYEPRRMDDDVFAMGLWLQEQELGEAIATFGAGLHNAKQIWSREPLRSRKSRDALCDWFYKYPPDERAQLFKIPRYAEIAKSLTRRWPSRGPGSTRRPENYGDLDLALELHQVLDPVAARLLA